jgi:hypothetical protein
VDCPRCRRPVAMARRQCLYCGADVSSVETRDRRAEPRTEPATPPGAIPGTALRERALVVVALDGVDPARLPAAFGISLYEARQWARRGGYHLQRVAAPADAAAYRQRLAAEGIAAYTLDETAVRAAADPEPALGGRFDGQVLRVRTPGGSVDIGAANLRLLVKGPITREHLPMESLRWSRTATLDPGFRFHLHRHDPPRPVEIDPATFDFGAHRARESSLLEIAGWITALAADVPVDDEFRRITPALGPAAPAAGAAARLEDALRTSAARPPAILDNVPQFRFYSAWRGAVDRLVRPR